MKLRGLLGTVVMMVMVMGTFVSVSAENYYVTNETQTGKGNISYPAGVTSLMTKTEFWTERTVTSAETILIGTNEINRLNALALRTKSTNMNDLKSMEGTYDATALKNNLMNGEIPEDDCYLKGELLDKTTYFFEMSQDIAETAYDGTREIQYGICVKGTPIKSWPTNDIIGYSDKDTDDEIQLSALVVNEPFVVKQIAYNDGHLFYWGYSDLVSGWVDADNIALCKDKAEWLDAWQVSTDGKDFVVVVQDKIVLEPSMFATYASEVKLQFSTILKLVKKEEIPRQIEERGPWNNYVVYLPTRNEEGFYEKKMALISEHCKVSVGFLPLTQKNLIDTSLQCLGNRYGWGGMLDAMDCSLFTRNVYKCCGVFLPRNTNWQQEIPGTKTDLSGLDDQSKQQIIEKMPAGTLLYFRGHTMIYLGSVNHVGYVISDLGTVSDSEGSLDVRSIQSVAITPLTVRRGKGTTWLSNLTGAVSVAIPKPEVTTAEVTTKEIKLPKTKIKKVAVKKKRLKITWKKVQGVTGYKLQYSKDAKFKKKKTITIKASKGTVTLKGIKKRTYYFRIRTYQKEKKKNAAILYYSAWSNIKRKKVQ